MKVSDLNKSQELAEGQLVQKAVKRLSKAERFLLASADKYVPAQSSHWASPAPESVVEAIDKLASISSAGPAGSVGAAKSASAVYDFSVSGGAIGTISLGVSLPANAIVLEVISDEITPLVSAGSASFVAGATSISGDLLASAGVQAHAVGPVKIVAPGAIGIVIAGAPVTAGKARVFVRYVISE